MKRLLTILLLLSFTTCFSQSKIIVKAKPYSQLNSGGGTDLDVTFQDGDNVGELDNVWFADPDGDAWWCGYSTNYLPASEAGHYYSDYVDGDQSGTFIGLSLATLNSCEIVFSVRYGLFPDNGAGFYRVRDGVAESFTTTSVVPTAGDKWGLFRDADGVVTAQYYRSSVWTIMHTFGTGSSANLFFSAEGTTQNPNPNTLVNPKSSPNTQ